MALSKKDQRRGWLVSYEDNPGGLYFRRVAAGGVSGRYLFASVTDMDDACGRDNIGQPRFAWEACLVMPDVIPVEEIHQAVHSGIGYKGLQEVRDRCGVQAQMDALAEALYSHGTRAPLNSGSATRWDRAQAAAIRDCDEAVASDDHLHDRLAVPINAIGTTALEAGSGDILGGLRRSAARVMAGEPVDTAAQIMLRAYAAAQGRTLGAGVETELAAAGSLLTKPKG